jgi:hypothetical protein
MMMTSRCDRHWLYVSLVLALILAVPGRATADQGNPWDDLQFRPLDPVELVALRANCLAAGYDGSGGFAEIAAIMREASEALAELEVPLDELTPDQREQAQSHIDIMEQRDWDFWAKIAVVAEVHEILGTRPDPHQSRVFEQMRRAFDPLFALVDRTDGRIRKENSEGG